jgi:RNA recognition motif-containing protein
MVQHKDIYFLSFYPETNLEHLGSLKAIRVVTVCSKMSVF